MNLKRMVALALALCLLLMMTACSSDKKDDKSTQRTTRSRVTTAATEATATQANATVATGPTSTASDILGTFTAEQRYTANVFLSNFTETNVFTSKGFDVNHYDLKQIAEFVFYHLLFNDQDALSHDPNKDYFNAPDNYYSYSVDNLKERVARFFDITLTDAEIKQAFSPLPEVYGNGSGPFLENNRIYDVIAYHTYLGGLSILTRVEPLANGHYLFYFDVYSIKSPSQEIDDAYYRYTSVQAEQESALDKKRTGVAEVKPYQYNGKASYQLVTYSESDAASTATQANATVATSPTSAASDILGTFTAEQRYTANIFLSNFAETSSFYFLDSSGFSVNSFNSILVDFVYEHLVINDPGSLERVDRYDSVSFDVLKERASRFFGIILTDEQILQGVRPLSEAPPKNDSGPFWEGDRLYYVNGSSHSHNCFAIVTEMKTTAIGFYAVSFDVYSVPDNETGVADSYYWLTSEQAEQNPDLKKEQHGIAQLQPYQYNGKASYQLVTYLVS